MAATTASTPLPAAAASLLGRAVVGAGAGGVALGLWCRAWAGGEGGERGAVLADLGAPWIVAAFVVGALVAARRPADQLLAAAGLALGCAAGAACLALASFAYYQSTTAPVAIAWAAVGVGVGGIAGAAGAAWRTWPGTLASVVAAAGLGAALAGEALWRLDLAPDVDGATARGVFVAVLAAGIAAPAALGGRLVAGLAGSVAVAALALPIAGAVAAGSDLLIAVWP